MPIIISAKDKNDHHPIFPSLDTTSSMDAERADHQDRRPLEILVLNLMAKKIQTEAQLAFWLGHSSNQVHLTLAGTDNYIHGIGTGETRPVNTPIEHIQKFYRPFSEIKHRKFDGLVITGVNAPEQDLTKTALWSEVKEILEWSESHTTSSLFLCWGAQAALKYFHGINRVRSPQKTYGVYDHHVVSDKTGILSGFSDLFPVPVSRFNEIKAQDILQNPNLELTALSDEAGVGIIVEPRPYDDGNHLFPHRLYVLNHPEYATETLGQEYDRDKQRDPHYPKPRHYFENVSANGHPLNTWRHTGQIYTNWVDAVYQATSHDIQNVPQPFRRVNASLMDMRFHQRRSPGI